MDTIRILLQRPAFYAALILASRWPTVHWYAARMQDGSDEPWGVLALLCAIGFALPHLFSTKIDHVRAWGCATCLALLWLAGSHLTPLLHAALIAGALASLLAPRAFWVGHTGLVFLSLPLISSLQFYGGYPLRWMIGKASALLLSAFGQSVETVGTVMRWQGEMIVIDAPCSGVRMLWSSLFFACLLACMRKLDPWRSIKLLQLAGATAFVANVARNCLLFYIESGLVETGKWAHSAIGIVVFAGALAVIGIFAKRQSKASQPIEKRPAKPETRFRKTPTIVLSCLCAALALKGAGNKELLFEGRVIANELSTEINQDLLLEGWYPLPFDDSTLRFAQSFPGSIMTYERGNRRLVVRVINRATRRYHLSVDCYRAIGYAIKPMTPLLKTDGTLWGRIRATRDGQEVEVRERVTSTDGQTWTDPSSWFWSAMLARSQGPWVAYSESIIESAKRPE